MENTRRVERNATNQRHPPPPNTSKCLKTMPEMEATTFPAVVRSPYTVRVSESDAQSVAEVFSTQSATANCKMGSAWLVAVSMCDEG